MHPRWMTPTALVGRHRSEEFEHTSSASTGLVRWAAVAVMGRISCSTTGTPASAACQAASDPASPPPMTGWDA